MAPKRFMSPSTIVPDDSISNVGADSDVSMTSVASANYNNQTAAAPTSPSSDWTPRDAQGRLIRPPAQLRPAGHPAYRRAAPSPSPSPMSGSFGSRTSSSVIRRRSSSPPKTTPYSFMMLPPEVRLQVYEEYMEAVRAGWRLTPVERCQHSLGLLFTNKLVHSELAPIVYREFTGGVTDLARFFKQANMKDIALIQRLVIGINDTIDCRAAEFVFSTIAASQNRHGKLTELVIDVDYAFSHPDRETAVSFGGKILEALLSTQHRVHKQLIAIRGLDLFTIDYQTDLYNDRWTDIWEGRSPLTRAMLGNMSMGLELIERIVLGKVERQLPRRNAVLSRACAAYSGSHQKQ